MKCRGMMVSVYILVAALATAQTADKLAYHEENFKYTIERLRTEQAGLLERQAQAREAARRLVKDDRAFIEMLKKQDKKDQKYISFREFCLNVLEANLENGLSDSMSPGRDIVDSVFQKARELGQTVSWQGNGLDQLSRLVEIYYTGVNAKNLGRTIRLLEINRSYGISDSRYRALERSAGELARVSCRIYPYGGSHEGVGLDVRNLLILRIIRDDVGAEKPGTAEYKARETVLLARWRRMGVDTDKLLAHKAAILKRIRKLTPADVGSTGWLSPEERQANETEWRVALSRAVHVKWLAMLESGDAEGLKQGLVDIGKTVGKFEQSSQMEAESSLEDLVATQKLAAQVLSQVPAVGQVMNIHAIISGETLDGEVLSNTNRALGALIALAPASVSQMRKHSPGLDKMLSSWGRQLSGQSDAVLKTVGSKLGFSVPQLKKMQAWADGDDASSLYDFMADLLEGEVRDRL